MWKEFLDFSESPVLQSTVYGVARFHNIVKVRSELHFELDVTQQVTGNLSIATFGNLHLVVDTKLGHNFTIMLVIVDDALYHTYAVSIGIDRTRS